MKTIQKTTLSETMQPATISPQLTDSSTIPPDICGERIDPNVFLQELRKDASLYNDYIALSEHLQQEFLNFCTGNAGLKISYDPFFKYVFDPAIAPERLSDFLTCLIGKKVTVKRVLPNEGGRLIEEGSLLIMDILVELEDGTLSNIEIQKIAYQFPGERIDCYSSDLLLRQYSRVRS